MKFFRKFLLLGKCLSSKGYIQLNIAQSLYFLLFPRHTVEKEFFTDFAEEKLKKTEKKIHAEY